MMMPRAINAPMAMRGLLPRSFHHASMSARELLISIGTARMTSDQNNGSSALEVRANNSLA
jgi:hypothetical protein